MASDNTTLATYPTPSVADGMVPGTSLIYDDWYPAMRAGALRGKKLSTAMLLGIPLVLGRRDDGRVFAMRDSCPHRGIPLSCGWFDGKDSLAHPRRFA
jgi:phenylpropionate dioxygenase-like ring-hydroxylating dioxygenase large terminal subunit